MNKIAITGSKAARCSHTRRIGAVQFASNKVMQDGHEQAAQAQAQEKHEGQQIGIGELGCIARSPDGAKERAHSAIKMIRQLAP